MKLSHFDDIHLENIKKGYKVVCFRCPYCRDDETDEFGSVLLLIRDEGDHVGFAYRCNGAVPKDECIVGQNFLYNYNLQKRLLGEFY